MNARQASLGLGLFSIGLGLGELFAARRITKALSADGNEAVVKAFGVREIVAGLGILQAPAHPARVWNRVAGDALDLGALGMVAARAPRNKTVWGAIAFVVGATALDVFVARALESGPAEAALF